MDASDAPLCGGCSMPEITIKDGKMSAVTYVQCTRKHVCNCGANFTITMN